MSNEPIMDNPHRALQLWPLLMLAAKTQTVLSYNMVAKMTGLANNHPDPLGRIAFYCMKNNLPLLSCLEINQDTGKPSAEFYYYDGVDIAAEQRRCFVHNWAEVRIPTLEEFEDAHRNGEKIKEEYKAKKKAAAA